jgi:hypothetical protein
MKIGSQKPPEQTVEQQSAPVVQAPLTGLQLFGGGAQVPAVQVLLQQLALPVHAAPFAAHGVLQRRVVGSHTPRQHWASAVQAAPSAKQVPLPNPQRGGSTVSSQLSVQQPRPEPELQVSPVGRQSRLERSIWHCPPWQMFEQQSAFAAQLSLSILQSPPPQRPLKQPSEQQSSAVVQATPSATQRLAHWVTPDIPVTGSQRALQHSAFIVQAAPDAWQLPDVVAPPPCPPPAWAPPPPPPTPEAPRPPAAALPSTPPRPAWLVPQADAASATSATRAAKARRDAIVTPVRRALGRMNVQCPPPSSRLKTAPAIAPQRFG